jgi:hypothetical protein
MSLARTRPGSADGSCCEEAAARTQQQQPQPEGQKEVAAPARAGSARAAPARGGARCRGAPVAVTSTPACSANGTPRTGGGGGLGMRDVEELQRQLWRSFEAQQAQPLPAWAGESEAADGWVWCSATRRCAGWRGAWVGFAAACSGCMQLSSRLPIGRTCAHSTDAAAWLLMTGGRAWTMPTMPWCHSRQIGLLVMHAGLPAGLPAMLAPGVSLPRTCLTPTAAAAVRLLEEGGALLVRLAAAAAAALGQ